MPLFYIKDLHDGAVERLKDFFVFQAVSVYKNSDRREPSSRIPQDYIPGFTHSKSWHGYNNIIRRM